MAQDRNEDTKKTVIAHPVPEQREAQGPTKLSDSPRGGGGPPPSGNQTTIVGFTSPRPPVTEPTGPAAKPAPAPVDVQPTGPVVGWLVVVGGPGRGFAKEIYVGRNSIGREPHNRIAIDFGDTAISREKAAFLTYDPQDNCFTVIPGEGTNIVRHNKAALHLAQPIASGDILTIGQTELRFVPLCGPEFSWEQA